MDANEYYDFDTASWGTAPSLPGARNAAGCAMYGSVAIFAGGYDYTTGTTFRNDVWTLDLANPSAAWTTLPSMSSRRIYHSLVVSNHYVFAVSGYTSHSVNPTVERLDMDNPTSWVQLPSLPSGKNRATSLVANGEVYVV